MNARARLRPFLWSWQRRYAGAKTPHRAKERDHTRIRAYQRTNLRMCTRAYVLQTKTSQGMLEESLHLADKFAFYCRFLELMVFWRLCRLSDLPDPQPDSQTFLTRSQSLRLF